VITLIGCLLLLSCDTHDKEYYDKVRIKDILALIETEFSNRDIDALMNHYHLEFLNNGTVRWEEREIWQDRMASYLLIDFQNIDIQLDGDRATVSFQLKLMAAGHTDYYNEPAEHGDISYFIYDNGNWRIYGNQHNYSADQVNSDN